jgi:hypothetical protein
MPAEPNTICGYALADVRKSLRSAIDRRATRAAHRWTAELVATPGAVGSLWASYWIAWASAQGGGQGTPTLPILLRQSWTEIAAKAHDHSDWADFRNDSDVRHIAAISTIRLLQQPQQTPVIWPSKELMLYDIGNMREATPPTAVDGPAVLAVWQRNEDSMELRIMAGRWLTFLETGDLRSALSAVAWSLLPPAAQGLSTPLKCAERGPAVLPAKARASPLWFWLEIGRAYMLRRDIHRGWGTMHAAIADAFRQHYRRWTATDRMRLLLAWILQIRASMTPLADAAWTAEPIRLRPEEVDLPYKEVAVDLDPQASLMVPSHRSGGGNGSAGGAGGGKGGGKGGNGGGAGGAEEEGKKAVARRAEAKMAEADAAIMASLGLTEEDL